MRVKTLKNYFPFWAMLAYPQHDTRAVLSLSVTAVGSLRKQFERFAIVLLRAFSQRLRLKIERLEIC